MTNDLLDEFWAAIEDFTEQLHEELDERWEAWAIDLSEEEKYEVVGGLLARQVSLATEIARSPSIWNAHVAPIILRAMVDTYITLAWILEDPLERSRAFVLYGLGQEKLMLEHHKQSIVDEGSDPANHSWFQALEEVLNAQRYTFLTEVNIGSWSELSTRKMAEQAGCIDIYNFAYQPFSAATHSMWNHIFRYNLTPCGNPLHRYHLVPYDPDLDSDPDYLYRVAKYVDKSFRLFDEKLSVACSPPAALKNLDKAISRLASSQPQDPDDEESSTAP